jgi:WD40 repeat protein
VRVWDATTGGEELVLAGHENLVRCVAFSPDGARLVSLSDRRDLGGERADLRVCRLWDAYTGTELPLPPWADRIFKMAYSPDGIRIATRSDERHRSGSENPTVRVWDLASGDCLEVIEADGDLAAIAAGLPCRALVFGRETEWRQQEETVIEATTTRTPLAWLPLFLDHLATHPSGRTWVGSSRHTLWLFALEGGD